MSSTIRRSISSVWRRPRHRGPARRDREDATTLIGKALQDGKAMLIDVDMERGYKPM